MIRVKVARLRSEDLSTSFDRSPTGITNRVLSTSPVFILSCPLLEKKKKAAFFYRKIDEENNY